MYLSLIPMVIGIGIATHGDYYFTMLGFCLTALGVLLAAIKVSNVRPWMLWKQS